MCPQLGLSGAIASSAIVGHASNGISSRRGKFPCAQGRALRSRVVTFAAPKGVLCDLDGVIYASGTSVAIPGAADTVRYFRERLAVPWLFVTNTSTKSREGLAARLRDMGVPCRAEDIVSPAKLAADWLRAHKAEPAALFVGPDLAPEFEGIQQLPPDAQSGAAAVVIGDMGLDWNYASLNRAFRLVMDGELRCEEAEAQRCGKCASAATATAAASVASTASASASSTTAVGATATATAGAAAGSSSLPPAVRRGRGRRGASAPPLTLISLGKGRYYKDTDGYSIDVGPFTAALEYATDQKALVLGKPDPLIFKLSAHSLGLQPEEVVMIGDDVRGDVGGAQAAGLRGLLVRTGKFREHDLHVGVTPHAVLPSIAELPEWWHQQQREQEQGQQGQQVLVDSMMPMTLLPPAAAVGVGVGVVLPAGRGRQQGKGNAAALTTAGA
ncbi:hypothetical protein Agub_g11705 [Astrephomene gubernaculifera]|uniref:Uncharacterized protein n=1 Tax=Astrephomene gubernaculifera TaxID=47775 RepID=A0AAD3DZD6_9CHLO|nr:hypothetical protein Agub_g11705 [Astrephomene gubernaculifera]